MEICVEKRHLVLFVALAVVFSAAGIAIAQTPTVGHSASEISAGTFGSGDFTFPNNLNVQNILAVQHSINVQTGNLFFPADVKGIFWQTTSQDNNKPHIDYSTTTGLWISTGTTGKPVNIEGGNLIVENNDVIANDIVAGSGITLGNVRKTEWPSGINPGSCPAGQVMIGIDASGNIICKTIRIGITHSGRYDFSKTGDSWTPVASTKWHVCYISDILHNDKGDDSNFAKRIKADNTGTGGKSYWYVKFTGSAERAGSNVRCYNFGIIMA